MLEKLMRLYVMAMAYDVRSPMPHLVGPPGCGKSTTAEQLTDLLGVKLHIINVSRLSPLEVEGVQMPHGSGEEMALKMLPATFWTRLNEGDIVQMDEFLRGFPEVYNSLLDVFTSRRVGAFELPKVFIMGASNSVVSYDKALEDRLLHIFVDDPRNDRKEKRRMQQIMVDALGLLPDMLDSAEMHSLMDHEVLPMFDLLDSFKGRGSTPVATSIKGHSLRNLIGQAQLREVQSVDLAELLDMNNRKAMQNGKPQYVLLYSGKQQNLPNGYVAQAEKLRQLKPGVLTEVQALNLELNLQLIELETIRNQKGSAHDDAVDDLFE